MGQERKLELTVGLFMVAGFAAFAYLSLQLGEFSPFAARNQYRLKAVFESISGLKKGATVEIAGVTVGRVLDISLDKNNLAQVTMLVDRRVPVSGDSIASVKTQGIIGDKFIKITLGGGERLKDDSVLFETESAVDIEALVSKYIFGGM